MENRTDKRLYTYIGAGIEMIYAQGRYTERLYGWEETRMSKEKMINYNTETVLRKTFKQYIILMRAVLVCHMDALCWLSVCKTHHAYQVYLM